MGTHPIFESDFDCLTEKMPANADNAKEVTKVDQEKINQFSRYNQQLGDIDVAVSKRDKIVTDIKDAAEIIDDLQIVEEDAPVYFRIGESFFLQTCDSVGDLIETEKSKLQSELDKFKADKKSIESDMDKLKVSLYAKFGDQIHLERE